MKGRGGNSHRKLELALMATYRAQAEPPLSGDLVQTILRDIRRQTTHSSRPVCMRWVDDVVWRTATVTVAVVVLMAVCAVGVVRTTTAEPGAIMAEGFASIPLLGEE